MNLSRAVAVIFACVTHHPSTNALELIQAQEGTKVEGKYIVTLKDEEGFARMSQAKMSRRIRKKAKRIAKDVHGNLEGVYTNSIHGFTAELSQDAVNNLLNDTRVAMVEEDGIVQVDAVGSWGLDRIDDKDLPLDGSYNPTFGNRGAGVTAYVIDTGILASHIEFEGRATQVFNSAGGPNTDCHGHGTHVAGTIGGKTYGVATKSKLVGVKVLSCTGGGTYSGVIAGINWVQKNAKKPATANLSLGGGKSASVNNAIKSLVNSGVTTVVAAGNSNRNACSYSPASEPSAITVASTTSGDTRSSFSNWGSCVDIFAPGSSIKSPWIGSNSATRTISGTSMASPHVCGAVALYLGQDSNLSPTAVASKLLADSVTNTISNTGPGTPNRMLFVGGVGYFAIKNSQSGMVLDIPAGNCDHGTHLITWTYHGGDNQLFYFGPNDSIMSKKCNMALDVRASDCSNGEKLIIWPAHGGKNQAFDVRDNGSIVNILCGKAIDMYGSNSKGRNLNMWDYHGGWNQIWDAPHSFKQ